jgi:hypothetical protein
VSADSSSTTSLQGDMNVVGTIQNVISYPSVLRTSGYVRMSGSPLFSYNSNVPNSFIGNSDAPSVTDIKGASSVALTNDQQMGPVTTVKHSAMAGTQENNRVNFGNIVSRSVAFSGEIMVSILVKASVNCDYVLAGYADGYSATTVHLEAGKWVRIVILRAKGKMGAGFTLVGWPIDSNGPTVNFSKLEESRGYLGTVLTTGAVNANGFKQKVP